MQTLVENEEPNLTKEDCIEYLGKNGLERYRNRRIARHERRCQAWFNCLTVTDQDKLRGSMYDPFHKDNWADAIRALRFLLEN